MEQMEQVVELSLKMQTVSLRRRGHRASALACWRKYGGVLVMAAGEVSILLVWALVAPLQYKRSCTEEGGGVWDGACVESVGRCRTDQGPAFVAALALWHILSVGVGMRICYKVRNLPSIMAEGKWVFTSFYSQLQVFVTAVPVLAMVRDDFETFELLKSLVICVTDCTTIAMMFIPKMYLAYRFVDFDAGAVSRFIMQSLSTSTQRDHVYENLSILRAGATAASPRPPSFGAADSELMKTPSAPAEGLGPVIKKTGSSSSRGVCGTFAVGGSRQGQVGLFGGEGAVGDVTATRLATFLAAADAHRHPRTRLQDRKRRSSAPKDATLHFTRRRTAVSETHTES